MTRDRVAIQDVAQAAHVSRSTAYYALSGGGRISEETRDRVRLVAKELGYRHNHLASSLSSQRSATIGVVLPAISSQVYETVVRGIEEVLSQNAYAPLLACSYSDATREAALVESLLNRAVEGLIVLPTDTYANTNYFKSLLAEEIPLVFAEQSVPDIATDWVCDDNEHTGYLGAQHLLDLGRTRLAFLVTPGLLTTSTAIQERLAGCRRALTEAALPPPVVLGEDPGAITNLERYAFDTVQDSLRQGPRFDGLVAAFDAFAFGALGALTQNGVRVPAEVSVVGCDDDYRASYSNPALTTVRLESQQVGMQAARMVLDRIRHENHPPLAPRHVRLQPALVIRGSSGPVSTPRESTTLPLPVPAK